MANQSKQESRKRRHRSIRKRIAGDAERPRLVVFRSLRYIYAQVIDDTQNKVLASATDQLGQGAAKNGKSPETAAPEGDKSARAKAVGVQVAKLCQEKGIKKVVFDRAGYLYHGRVAKVAEGAREGGLEF